MYRLIPRAPQPCVAPISASPKCCLAMLSTFKHTAIAVLLLVGFAASAISVAHASPPPAAAFGDSFEGLLLYPYWSVIHDFGSIALSKDVSYSGSHALKFSSVSGGDRQISLVHSFGLLTKGTVSIAFYDVAPGQETLYEQLSVYKLEDW